MPLDAIDPLTPSEEITHRIRKKKIMKVTAILTCGVLAPVAVPYIMQQNKKIDEAIAKTLRAGS